MLYRATAQNFGSIRGREELDFTISGKVEIERQRQLLGPYQIRIPKVSAILGANASGKTTALRAISIVTDLTLKSASYPPESPLYFQPFSDVLSYNQPTILSLEFTADWTSPGKERPYRYTLITTARHIAGQRYIDRELLEMRVSSQWATLIDRTEGKATFKREFERFDKAVPQSALARNNASVIALLLQFVVDDPIAKSIRFTLSSVQSNMAFWFRKTASSLQTANIYARNEGALKALNKFIRKADLGIKGVRLEELKNSSSPDRKEWLLFFQHSGINRDLMDAFESQGTKNFVGIFPYLHHALETGGLALMDEMDSDLHPELLHEVTSWFLNEETNSKGAQLIMTCNNSSILDFLRKEEIYFASKDDAGRTSIYALKDIPGVRRGANFQRDYLAGRYGAVPRMG